MKKAVYSIIIGLLLTTYAVAQRPVKGTILVIPIDQTAITVTLPSNNAEPGTDFTIPVTVADTTGLDIISYQFDLLYDPAVIQPQGSAADTGGTLSSNLSAVSNPNTPGILKVAVYGAYPLTGSGTLINLTFKAVGSTGSISSLRWVNFMFNEGNPGANPLNGEIRIAPRSKQVNFSGRETSNGVVNYQNNGYRRNTLAMVADDQAKESSMVVSFDFVSSEGRDCFRSAHGEWNLMIYERGVYVGAIYGDVPEGAGCDKFDNLMGTTVQRTIRALFRIQGGIGRYENITLEPIGEHEYTSTTTYTNVKSVKAVLKDMP